MSDKVVRERPILFSAPMVRALLDGRKTQTRRIYKNRKHPDFGCDMAASELACEAQHVINRCCPYGQPSDLLWVRENGWERPERSPKMMRDGADTWAPYYYDADYEANATRENEFAEFKEWGFKRRPSIHMPRWASRITLEIISVRVERLQDISEADVKAEGITLLRMVKGLLRKDWTPQRSYSELWEQINGPGSWAANPWVWVIEFRRIKP